MSLISRIIAILCVLSGTECAAQGSGTALRFDGSSDYVEVESSDSWNTSNALTVCFWVYPYSTASRQVFISRWNDVGVDERIWSVAIDATPNRIRFDTSPDGVFDVGNKAVSATALQANQWVHIAVTHDPVAGTNRIYLNGRLDAEQTGVPPTLYDHPQRMRIASSPGFGGALPSYMNAVMDEVQVWERVLTAAEIRDNMCQKLSATGPNLRAHYPMDEGADGTCPGGEDVCDASGNGHHGVKQ